MSGKNNLDESKTTNKKNVWRIIWKITRYFLYTLGGIFTLVILFALWIYFSIFSGPGLMEMNDYHPFRSQEKKEIYLEHYESQLKEWPVAYKDDYIDTEYGRTFIRISGEGDAPPLVLLPGAASNVLIWEPVIKQLSEHYKVYSVDNIYDFGKSIYTREMTKTIHMMEWLDELLEKLESERKINLLGLSYGGWVSAEYSAYAPEKLNKVILMAPAATVFNFPPEFIKTMIISIIPHKYFLRSSVYWSLEDAVNGDSLSLAFVDKHIGNAWLGLRSFKFKQPPPPLVLSDEKLKSVSVPVLFLVGENEKLYPAESAAKRMSELVPEIQTEIIDGCGHDLWIVQKEKVVTKILKFLGKN